MTGRVGVVGGGVIGLTVACELAESGREVTVLAAQPAAASVSAVAGGLWFPYRVAGADRDFLRRSLQRFVELADTDPAAGVDQRAGVVLERADGADRSWTEVVAECRVVPGAPWEVRAAVETTLPMVTVPVYLDWLTRRLRRAGVEIRTAEVASVAAALEHLPDAAAVVVAAGAGSAGLLGDDLSVQPVRGQVVRLRNPGLTRWLVDDEHPDGVTYVLPRRDDVVCGGTAEIGATSTEVDPDVETAILRRAVALEPSLAGAEVVGRAVGLRPTRPSLRIERVPDTEAVVGVPVVACYGHGGAGVSLSWASAERVVQLLG